MNENERKAFDMISRIGKKKREFEEPPTSGEDIPWILTSSSYFLINPGIRCPFCAKSVPSKRNWLLRGNKVMRLWMAEDGSPVSVARCHPHVNGSGNICMGTSSNAIQALFNSIFPEDAYLPVDVWMKNALQHNCDNFPRLDCFRCKKSILAMDAVSFNENIMCLPCRDFCLTGACTNCYIDLTPSEIEWSKENIRNEQQLCWNCQSAYLFDCAGSCQKKNLDARFISRFVLKDKTYLCNLCHRKDTRQCEKCYFSYLIKTQPGGVFCKTCSSIM